MKEYWTDKLRQRLEGHKAEPPAGLWDDIGRQMGMTDGAKPLSRPAQTAHRYWLAAAAAVLALVGFFIYQNMNDGADEPIAASVVEKGSPSEPQPAKAPPQAKEPLQAKARLQAKTPQHAKAPHQAKERQPQSCQPLLVEAAQTEQADSAQTDDVGTKASHEDRQTAVAIAPNDNWAMKQHAGPGQSKWSVAVNASGGLLAAHSTESMNNRVYMVQAPQEDYVDASEVSPGVDTHYIQTDILAKHHLPVRIGVGVQYQLNSHLALFSGLSYTYLYSEFSIPIYNNISYTQKLHYLGIPVGVSCRLWSAGRFSLYLSGQTMLEKSLNDTPWQWSLGASAGAEYGISRQLGLYLQPSFSYYFRDGSSLEHYYKEHPFAPSFEFGLRLHLEKSK